MVGSDDPSPLDLPLVTSQIVCSFIFLHNYTMSHVHSYSFDVYVCKKMYRMKDINCDEKVERIGKG